MRTGVSSERALPLPVPPDITKFSRHWAMISRRRAPSLVMDPNLTRSSSFSLSFLNFRMVMQVPSMAMGGMTMATRDPSLRRASQIGLLSSTRRPTAETMREATLRNWSSSRNFTSVRRSLPLTSMNIFLGPQTMMSDMSSRASSSSRGPSPRMSLAMSLIRTS